MMFVFHFNFALNTVRFFFFGHCAVGNQIGEEAMACRHNAVVFNMSYFCKLYLEGPDAQKAADWIFSANTNRDVKK